MWRSPFSLQIGVDPVAVVLEDVDDGDARVIATLAFVGFAFVFWLRSNYVIEIDTWHLVLPTLLQGIPMALFFVPLTAIILAGQPPQRVPAAAGLVLGLAAVRCRQRCPTRSCLHHRSEQRRGGSVAGAPCSQHPFAGWRVQVRHSWACWQAAQQAPSVDA